MEGFLVLVQSDHRLFGKIVGCQAGTYDVEHFLSVASRQVARYRRAEVVHARLQKQTRVFWNGDSKHWRVGRIQDALREDDGCFRYEVRFPNGVDADLHEKDLYVRCLDEFADPADILAMGCAETQYFSDRRRRALRRLGNLRAAGQSLTGLLSAAVEFVPHQIAAVRRVLTDPLQRYLLADEVGLGKTIEAGIIIRQLLLDGTVERVLILAPDKLVDQWKSELTSKFLGGDLAQFGVEVRAHSHAPRAEPEATPDLLVVDEAHRVVAVNVEEQTSISGRIRELAQAAPRLLLLSATPALADERRFLAMLNLLDPASFPLDQPEAFQQKVANRQEIGRFLLAFRPSVHTFVLKQQAQRALDLFKDDEEVARIVADFLGAVQAGASADSSVIELRDHVARTYRIHQRMIRARRSDIDGWAMWPRGPKLETDIPSLRHVRLEFDDDPRNVASWNALESWRDGAIRACDSQPELRARLAQRGLSLHTNASAGADVLTRFVSSLSPLFEAEAELLAELRVPARSLAGPLPRHVLISRALRDWKAQQVTSSVGRLPPKICCFCSDATDAAQLAAHLQSTMGLGFVSSIVGPQARPNVVKRFEQDRDQWILVCDAQAEEGLNLQFAHTLFHADLPFSPARLEQRIGRLDRFGRRINGVSHRILLPVEDDESPWSAWFALLANAFLIFNQSVSDVQFLLEVLEAHIGEALLTEGAEGLNALTERISSGLKEERTRLDEQHALDSLALLQETGSEIAKDIEASEDDEEAISRDLVPWIANVLRLSYQPADEGKDLVRLGWTDDTLLPSIPWRQLFAPALDRPSTWKRHRALLSGAQVELIRPGSALIDALERVARWDDRGIAYSTWRVDPGWKEVWRGFRLIWVVEADCSDIGPVYRLEADPALRRQSEGFLRPARYEQVFDEEMTLVTDPVLLAAVRRPYAHQPDTAGRCDVNLGSRPSDLQQEVDAVLFGRLVSEVRTKGNAVLLGSGDYLEMHAAAQSRCRQETVRGRASLRQRANMHLREHGREAPWLQTETSRLDAVEAAIRTPKIRLDEMGFLVIASHAPPSMVPT